MRKFCKKLIFKKGDTNIKKNGSVLLYLNTSGLDNIILCLVGALHLSEIQKQQKICVCKVSLSMTHLFQPLDHTFNKAQKVLPKKSL